MTVDAGEKNDPYRLQCYVIARLIVDQTGYIPSRRPYLMFVIQHKLCNGEIVRYVWKFEIPWCLEFSHSYPPVKSSEDWKGLCSLSLGVNRGEHSIQEWGSFYIPRSRFGLPTRLNMDKKEQKKRTDKISENSIQDSDVEWYLCPYIGFCTLPSSQGIYSLFLKILSAAYRFISRIASLGTWNMRCSVISEKAERYWCSICRRNCLSLWQPWESRISKCLSRKVGDVDDFRRYGIESSGHFCFHTSNVNWPVQSARWTPG